VGHFERKFQMKGGVVAHRSTVGVR